MLENRMTKNEHKSPVDSAAYVRVRGSADQSQVQRQLLRQWRIAESYVRSTGFYRVGDYPDDDDTPESARR
jgi:hypothetical protein